MLSVWLDQFFSTPIQLDHMRAWAKHFFESAINYEPMPGPNFILMGIANVGKTLLNREVIGRIVGGYADASGYLVDGCAFNSELFQFGHWCLDDDSPSNSPRAQHHLQAMLKKMAANQQHMVNTKFVKSCMVDFCGRVGCTTNLDFISSRIVGPLDNTSLDKTVLFRCNAKPTFKFPSRKELIIRLQEELPKLLRWIIDWTPPDHCERHTRYGYAAYQEPSLLDQAHQSSPTATFKEVLIEFLGRWFESSPKDKCWEGTVSQLMRGITTMDCNDLILRAMKLEQVSRHLEQIQREGYFQIEVVQGKHNTRLWRFYRESH